MILHTQHDNGLKARVVLDDEGHMGYGRMTFCVHLYTRDDEYCDSYYTSDLPQAMRAIGPGLSGGNFDRFRADERCAAEREALSDWSDEELLNDYAEARCHSYQLRWQDLEIEIERRGLQAAAGLEDK